MSAQSNAERKTIRTQLRKVVAASMAGTVVEWYEFFLYGSAATLVFNHILFPPSDNPLTPILLGFATYAVGFIARPIGGIVFGHYGDKFGRKKLLQLSIILVGAATFLMGCLPTFGQIGYLAPILLVLLRIVQGFAVGGEWGGAVLLVAEHSPDKERGFWSSWPQSGVPLGNLLATGVLFVLTATLSEEAFLSWGWRIAFWLSAVIVLIGYYIRTRVSDAPIFEKIQAEEIEEGVDYGVKAVFKRYPREVFTAMGLRLVENIHYYLVVTFSITYLAVAVGIEASEILGLLLGAHAIHALLVPMIGALGDRIGRKPPYAIGIILTASWGFFAFPMYDTGNPGLIFLALLLGLVFHGFMYAGQPAIMAEMFPTRMRNSGVSTGYQVTAIVAGSFAPIIATALLDEFGSSVPIAIYLAVAALISLVALIFTRETKGIDLHSLDHADKVRRGVVTH
ncbi:MULTISPECIES: MFS transporter [Brevibacterium]|uniref:Putative proline/betaine transporter n=4 Tax=Bacteria TaxID=2 RepID=K9B0F2_9MICO|nr:MFS transporter [Brevibacterium casei]NJE66282.1 MFS transporter [Brevibacterium sp. LS14]SIG89381.1 general substrate transporter [Mycobacteroides abscessus subsp. abscessus]EKU48282.1 general substrate transporter [Brevibacterium casei S18]KZE21550.1 MFS transporter [Brevibacterium casei]MBE4695010.1 MHS family MFS transporter [Brevibacterium casei]